MDDTEVSGLLLKWGRAGERALVTYEIDGRVATLWLPAQQLRPAPDLVDDPAPEAPLAPEALATDPSGRE